MRTFLFYHVKDVMTRNPMVVDPDQTLADAEVLLEQNHFNGIPVVDTNRRLLGILTQFDILAACAKRTTDWYPAVMRQPVSQVMTRDTVTVSPMMPLSRVLEKFEETRNKSFPVMEDDELIGVISREDVLKALRRAGEGTIPARLISPELEGLLEPTYLHEK